MYVYGRNTIKEIMKKNENIEKIYLQNNFNDQSLKSMIQKMKIKTEYLPKVKLDELANGNHQGIIALVDDFKYSSMDDLKMSEFLVILDHLEDPHNFGAIIRTCEAAGVDGIIIPKNRSVSVNSTVSKVSTGTINNMKIVRVVNLVNTINELKKNGFWIVGSDMNGIPYSDIDYKSKIAIIIGNEGNGMSDLVKKNCDFIASIPMKGTVNSLNASVAAGILIFEALRQRG